MKMNYREILKVATKPDLKPFDTFTKWGPFSLNGYVVIPDNFPVDYCDDFYKQIDDSHIGGLTYGAYFTLINNELKPMQLDQHPYFNEKNCTAEELQQIEQLKNVSIRVIGFDDNHIKSNELGAEEGAKYLAAQLMHIFKE